MPEPGRVKQVLITFLWIMGLATLITGAIITKAGVEKVVVFYLTVVGLMAILLAYVISQLWPDRYRWRR